MPRADFAVNVPGSLYRNGTLSHTCPDARWCQETTTGVRRIKPEGFMDPTEYFFQRDFYERHHGTLHFQRFANGVLDVDGDTYSDCVGIGTDTSVESLACMGAVHDIEGIPQAWIDKALIKARLAMKNQSVNLVVAGAEIGLTAKLVGDTATRIAKAGNALLHKDIVGCARQLGVAAPRKHPTGPVSNQWLEFQYGWLPLLQDVNGAAEALAKRPNSDWRVTGKGSQRGVANGSKLDSNAQVAAYGLGRYSSHRGVDIRIDAIPANDMLLTLKQCGVTNPALVAWELVPFSFVVDWFLPVGSFVDSFDAMLGYGPTKCSISTLERFWVEHTLLDSDWSTSIPGTTFSYNWSRSGRARREYVRMQRRVSDTVPLPSLPRLKNPASMKHMANGLALLASIFGKR